MCNCKFRRIHFIFKEFAQRKKRNHQGNCDRALVFTSVRSYRCCDLSSPVEQSENAKTFNSKIRYRSFKSRSKNSAQQQQQPSESSEIITRPITVNLLRLSFDSPFYRSHPHHAEMKQFSRNV